MACTARLTPAQMRAITAAIDNETPALLARLAPGTHENVFWALRQAGCANDSGFITDAARAAVGRPACVLEATATS